MKKLAGNLLITSLFIVLSFAIAESIARYFFPAWAPRTARITNFWKHDDRYGWAHIPGVTGNFRVSGKDTKVSINSKGFRGPEFPYQSKLQGQRVLVMGDSFVWGFGVEEEQVFTRLAEGLLSNIEIVNLGVSGYSTDQELLLYKDKGFKYRADLVVLVVAGNDFSSNSKAREYRIFEKPMFIVKGETLVLTNQPVPKPQKFKGMFVKLAWHSYLLTKLNRTIDILSVKAFPRKEKFKKKNFLDWPPRN